MKISRKLILNKPFILSFTGGFLLFLSLFLYLFDPLNIIINKLTAFYDGSIAFEAWKNPEYEIFIKLYIFNMTNIEDFQNGIDSKLKVKEIGPFVYQERISNSDIVFNENGTMTYVPHRSVSFIPEKSIADPKSINVTVPNIPLLGILSYIEKSSFVFKLAISSITNLLDSKPFLSLPVEDFLWGYDDPLIQLANDVVPSWIFFRRFGVLDRLFDEGNNSVTIVTDADKYKKYAQENNPLLQREDGIHQFAINRWNGSPGLSQWGYKDSIPMNQTTDENTFCNLLEGAFEGIMFPRDIGTNFTFRLYRKAFCRTLQFVYHDRGIVNDRFDAFWFKLRDNFLDTAVNNADNECYCRDNKNNCLPKGFSFITPCYYGIPIAISLPHFMNADQNIIDSVDGMKPNKSIHESSLAIHPKLGIPLKVSCKIQLNLAIKAKFHGRAPIFDNRIVPLFWVELSVEKPPPKLEFYLILLYDVVPFINYAAIVICGVMGFICFILSTFQLTYKISASETATEAVSYNGSLKHNSRLYPLMSRSQSQSQSQPQPQPQLQLQHLPVPVSNRNDDFEMTNSSDDTNGATGTHFGPEAFTPLLENHLQ